MNAKDIQKYLYYYLCRKSHDFICPNKFLDNWWECDMISVTNADYLHEYEIKISIADFKKDFEKAMKHLTMEANLNNKETVLLENTQKIKGLRCKKLVDKDDKKYWESTIKHLSCPSYFWYTTPKGLLSIKDIPEYAGFLEVFDNGHVKVVKQAPRLNKNKITRKVKDKILISMSRRFWDLKLKQ